MDACQTCINYNQFFNFGPPIIEAHHSNSAKHKRSVEFDEKFLSKPELTSQLEMEKK
jgi:hypothetical protein